MFLQTGVVLFERQVSLAELNAALADAPVTRSVPPDDGAAYWFTGEGMLVVDSHSGAHGGVAIEPFNRAWPDAIREEEPELSMLWTLRQFGVEAYPLALARASAGESSTSSAHEAFVRLNLSYRHGAEQDALVSPEDRDVRAELRALARLAAPLCALPGAVAWFAPNGEVLLSVEEAAPLLARQAAGELVPELWVSTRAYTAGRHLVVETVGVATLGAPSPAYDHQLLLPDLGLEGDLVRRFVQELAGAARLGSSAVPSQPVVGPGGRWTPQLAESDNPPPREVVRWVHDSEIEGPRVAVAELDDEEADCWSQHLARHLGAAESVLHELLSDTIHLDVLVYPATPERPHHVLVTQGMSALPMTVPDGEEDSRFAELMVVLPPDWVIAGEPAQEKRWYWPVRALKRIARLPHLHDTWIDSGHTIPNGDPAQPYDEDTTQLCCMIAAPPTLFGEGLAECRMPQKTVRLHALIPMHEDEVAFKLEHGAEAFFQQLEARGVSERIDPQRRSTLAKRLWVV